MKVELIDHMGSDLSVVNAARVSFDKESDWVWEEYRCGYDQTDIALECHLSDKDTKLIQFLARGLTTEQWERFVDELSNAVSEGEGEVLTDLLWSWRRTPEHFAPFAHPHVTFRIKAPIFVARQLGKHQVGMVWSEVSRRYVSGEPEFYVPEVWRKKAENVKQGSSDSIALTEELIGFKSYCDYAKGYYQDLLDSGVCPEQARMVLPQSMMTEWIWTGSLYGWANVYNKRKPGSHAQRECWPIAEQIAYHMANLFPVSWEALTQ